MRTPNCRGAHVTFAVQRRRFSRNHRSLPKAVVTDEVFIWDRHKPRHKHKQNRTRTSGAGRVLPDGSPLQDREFADWNEQHKPGYRHKPKPEQGFTGHSQKRSWPMRSLSYNWHKQRQSRQPNNRNDRRTRRKTAWCTSTTLGELPPLTAPGVARTMCSCMAALSPRSIKFDKSKRIRNGAAAVPDATQLKILPPHPARQPLNISRHKSVW